MGDSQELLKKVWTGGRKGCLSALSEAKLWAIREVWRSEKQSEHGMLTFASRLVFKFGTKQHPTSQAVGQFYAKIDDDPAWFPGKCDRSSNGPDRALSHQQVSAIARCAQSMKERNIEPTYQMVLASCPSATINQETNMPVDKKLVYIVFREKCKDVGSDKQWVHKARYSKVALSSDMKAKRLAFAKHVRTWKKTQAFYYNHVVWTDICNSILPRSERKAAEQALSRKGKKGWSSPGCEMHSSNLRGAQESLKLNSEDTIKVWWSPI